MYQVKDWDKYFEYGRSKHYVLGKSSAFLPCKTGLGYLKLLSEPNGEALYGAWCAAICLLSRQKAPRCGYFTANGLPQGEPLTAADIALTTHFSAPTIAAMLTACSLKKIGWITIYEYKDTERIPHVPESDVSAPNGSAMAPIKKRNKRNKRKEINTLPRTMFADVWAAYPKKRDKPAAIKAFRKIAPDEELLGVILGALEKQKKSPDWHREDGRFIPYPSKWLNGRRWEDEVQEEVLSDADRYIKKIAEEEKKGEKK